MATDFLTGQSPQYGFAHIAWIVVLSAFVHRAVFGYSLIGDREKVAERVGSSVTSTTWLSSSRFATDHLSVWMATPDQSRIPRSALIDRGRDKPNRDNALSVHTGYRLQRRVHK